MNKWKAPFSLPWSPSTSAHTRRPLPGSHRQVPKAPALVRGRRRQNSLEETLMLLESSPSLLLTLQVTLRLALGTMLMLWVALPLA